MRKVFLDDLPHKGKHIDWKNSVGCLVHFIYDDIEDCIKIIGYKVETGNNRRRQYLNLTYNDKYLKIKADNLKNGHIGNLINKVTSDFKIKIGESIKDNKRDITIIDRKYIKDKNGQNKKYYKYKCNNPECGFACGKHYSIKDRKYKEELWICEGNINLGNGCACCCPSPQVVVEGINDISTTHPELVRYFKYSEDTKKYTKGSTQKVQCVCPDCGRDKYIKVITLYSQGLGCSCGDGKSYPEKFMMSVLEQIHIDFEMEYTPRWDKLGNRRYDFYFKYNNKEYIIETHGIQHYKETKRKGARTLEEEQENDRLKKQLALDNGIKEENYIVIDCRESELEWIKNNILHSKLSKIFNLSKVNWLNSEEFALTNLVKITCKVWKDNPKITTTVLGGVIGLDRSTIIKYLKVGAKLGWCNYDTKEESRKSSSKAGKSNGKPVKIFKTGMELGVYPSCAELERCSEKDFGVKLFKNVISVVCNNKLKQYKGFTFKYVEENESNQLYNQELVQAS